MRLLIPIFLSLFHIACTTSPASTYISEEELNDSTSNINIAELVTLKKGTTYRFYIPSAFTSDPKGPNIDTLLSTNYLSLEDGNFEAKFYTNENGDKFLAINGLVSNEKCLAYFCFILQQNENGIPSSQFESIFPNLSAHSFYKFGDKYLNQLEGDEQTIFSGYRLDLSKTDSLGVQFMFCNQKNSVNSAFLNNNGKIIYKNFVKL